MNLVTDIGNTHIKAALTSNGRILERMAAIESDHGSIAEWIRMQDFSRAIICSSGKTFDDIVFAINRLCSNVITLDHYTPVPVKVIYNTPLSLGYDRLAAAAGAFSRFRGNDVLIIDAGTAITVDMLNSAGEYLGGNISPGLQTRFRSLNEFTAGLPLVEKDHQFPEFGNDTRSAIAAGVQQGIIFELKAYSDNFVQQHKSGVVVATGGDAQFLIPKAVKYALILPDLVLEGLDCILDFNFR